MKRRLLAPVVILATVMLMAVLAGAYGIPGFSSFRLASNTVADGSGTGTDGTGSGSPSPSPSTCTDPPPDGFAMTASTDSVTPFNTSTGMVGPPITVGANTRAIAITPDGKTAYVVSLGTAGTVTPIDTATCTPGPPIPVAGRPHLIAITPDGKTAYVVSLGTAGAPGTVTPIDTGTNTAGTPITVGTYPRAIAITPDGTTAYVANYLSGSVTPIDTATNTAGTPIPVGHPRWIAITPDGKTVYVTSDGPVVSGDGPMPPPNPDAVTPIDTATNTAGPPISIGANPWAGYTEYLAAAPDGKTVYVIETATGVVPIDTATNTAGTLILTGENFTLRGTTLYVSDPSSGTVTPVDTATNTAGTPIQVGTGAGQIAITP